MPNLKVYLFKLIYQIVNCLLVKFTESLIPVKKVSIDRYGKVIDTLTNSYPTHNIIIGTDQNFDYMKMNNNNNISLLFDTFCSAGIIPVIDKSTRKTHSSATCIDNIYVKCSPYKLSNAISGIIETDISDSHMPVFVFTRQKEKHSSTKGPLRFTCSTN